MKTAIWGGSILLVLAVYLFVTAPPPLGTAGADAGEPTVAVSALFEAVNGINARTRQIWTARIVSPGQEAGLKFAENWQDDGVVAGPLPALFLRLTASRLEAARSPLALFLGSDEPINQANGFRGEQVTEFARLRLDRKPRFFAMPRMQIEVAMFADVASTHGCVSCHNDHPSSPKHDWRLDDVMGAVTWTYPRAGVSEAELRDRIAELYRAVREAYEIYLDRVRATAPDVQIGERWPEKGRRQLPDSAAFMGAVVAATAGDVTRAAFLDGGRPQP